jgi:hypothetical protein
MICGILALLGAAAMGREAITQAVIGEEAGEVRALLESSELILRGAIRRRFARDRMTDIRADGEALSFACGSEDIVLHLGRSLAEKWVKAIATPPPSLRAKLGLTPGMTACRIGCFDDDVLAEAIEESLIVHVAQADMIIACIAEAADLDRALAAHAAKPDLPIWTVYPKGKGIAFGDGEVRTTLRAKGFRDTKSCAISDRLTATRYGKSR